MDEFEPNNGFASAQAINLDERYYPTIYPYNDRDYFKIQVDSAGKLRVSLSDFPTDFQPYIYVYDSEQMQVAVSFGFSLTAQISSSGTYYIFIREYYGRYSLKPYVLRASFTPDTIYTPEQGALFEEVIGDVNIGIGEAVSVPVTISSLDMTGKFILRSELFNSLNQSLAFDKVNFYIQDEELALTFSADKEIYQIGEAVGIVGEVRAGLTAPARMRTLTLFKDGEVFYDSEFYLGPGEIYDFTAGTIAADSFKLSGIVGPSQITVEEYVEVAAPALEAGVTAPEVAGMEAFDIEVLLENTGNVPLAEQITIAGEQRDVNIPVGESRLEKFTEQISQDTTFTIEIAGDISQTIQKEVVFGEGAGLTLDIDVVYPEGNAEIPWTITNTGQLDTEFDTLWILNGVEQTKVHFVPQGASITDFLYYDLTEGAYMLSWTTPFEIGSVNFDVLKESQLSIDVNLGASDYGQIPVDILLENIGYNDIKGRLILDAGFWLGEQEVEILIGAVGSYGFQMDTQSAQQGLQILKASVISYEGLVIQELAQNFAIDPAEFVILSQKEVIL